MRLALGTAQFGMDYGVANRRGRVPASEVGRILALARAHELDTLDTAIDYGGSEQTLGSAGVAGWRVVSKLPAPPADCADLPAWVESAARASLSRLRLGQLYGFLLHRPMQLLGGQGATLYAALRQLQAAGLTQKIGVSIYDPAELDPLCDRFAFDLIQAPLNLFDHRLVDSGWLAKAARLNIEVHARSVFLQGALLMNPADRAVAFSRWPALWKVYDEWLDAHRITPLQASLRYALSVPGISRVVVGVDSHAQLRGILAAAQGELPPLPAMFAVDDASLINPALWVPGTAPRSGESGVRP